MVGAAGRGTAQGEVTGGALDRGALSRAMHAVPDKVADPLDPRSA
jgi:hypothetical protein